jgi:hypothetical protein
MGHDLDQVMRHAPGALAALRQQRALLDQQITSLEHMVEAHDALILKYNVNGNGVVEDVEPLLPVPPTVEDRRTLRDKVLEAVDTMDTPVTAEDVRQLIGTEWTTRQTVTATLTTLAKQEKIARVGRGLYCAAGQ